MTVTQRQLDASRRGFSRELGDDPDRHFARLFLEAEYGCASATALNQVATAPSRTGLTGYHIDRDHRNLILLICHWGDDHDALLDRLNTLITGGLPLLFASDGNDRTDAILEALLGEAPTDSAQAMRDPFAEEIRGALLEEREAVQQVLIQLVYNGDSRDLDKSTAVAQLNEELDQRSAVVEHYFGRQIRVASVFLSERLRRRHAHVARPTPCHPPRLDQPVTMCGPSGEMMLVGFARLADLGVMYRAMGQELLDRNIRAGPSEEASPNRAITEALRRMLITSDADPSLFAFHHNGVTLAANDCRQISSGLLLTAPRLLNGAQTVTTFARFVAAQDERVDAERLGALRVLCKVITRAEPDFVTQVTINNNRQNPVMPWHLRANDLIQVRLQDRFASQLGIYYERQENAFATLPDEELERLGVVDSKRIEILKLAATFLATDGRVDKMSHLREVFENDRLYLETFNDDRLAANPRQVIVCYKMQRTIAKLLPLIAPPGDERFAFLYRARNLIWALLCQGFLNEPRRTEGLTRKYGGDLVVSQAFREEIRAVATARVRPILAELLRQEIYSRQVSEERYGFLTTRAVFGRAMEIASARYSWQHRRLR